MQNQRQQTVLNAENGNSHTVDFHLGDTFVEFRVVDQGVFR